MKKNFNRNNLACLGVGRSLAGTGHIFICITSVGLGLILTRRKDVPQRKDEFMETSLLSEKNEQSCVERTDKD